MSEAGRRAAVEADEPAHSSSSTDQLTPQSDSDEDLGIDVYRAAEGSGRSFELKKLTTHIEHGEDNRPSPGPDVQGDDDDSDPDDEDELWKEDEHGDGYVGTRPSRRASASTTQSFTLYTPDEERSVVRKLDRRVVLLMALLYMLSFLDRSSTLLPSGPPPC